MKRLILALFLLGCDASGLRLGGVDGRPDSAAEGQLLTSNSDALEEASGCSIIPIASITGCTDTRIPVPSPGITPDMVVFVDGARLGPMSWVRGTEIWGNEWYSPDGHSLIVTQCNDPTDVRTIGVTWGCK